MMEMMPLVQQALLWGLIFGGVFTAATLILGKMNSEMLVNQYPPDIRARFGDMDAEVRRQANLASLLLMAVLLGVIVLALLQLRQIVGKLTFLNTFIYVTVILQVWNLIDLLVLDWFILMTLRPRFMILPGTEGLAGYRDYRFHFRKFLNGIVVTLVLSGLITGVAVGLEALL